MGPSLYTLSCPRADQGAEAPHVRHVTQRAAAERGGAEQLHLQDCGSGLLGIQAERLPLGHTGYSHGGMATVCQTCRTQSGMGEILDVQGIILEAWEECLRCAGLDIVMEVCEYCFRLVRRQSLVFWQTFLETQGIVTEVWEEMS